MLQDKYSFALEGTNGRGVVLIHGLTGIPAEMKLVAKQLQRVGYSVYAPLLRGHGKDVPTLLKTRWQDWRDGLLEDIQHFASRVDSLFTAGICVGGKLGMLAAEEMKPKIAATAIYSPCFRFDGWNVPWYYKLAPVGLPVVTKLPWCRHRSYSETETLGIKDERLRTYMASAEAEGVINDFPVLSLWEMYQLGARLKKRLPHITTPTLVVHAQEDDLSHPRNATVIASRIGAPHELYWVENSYHMVHVDKQYPQVAQRTAEFFARHHA